MKAVETLIGKLCRGDRSPKTLHAVGLSLFRAQSGAQRSALVTRYLLESPLTDGDVRTLLSMASTGNSPKQRGTK